MDKIKIKYYNAKTNYCYQIRVPKDFEWFEIFIKNEKDDTAINLCITVKNKSKIEFNASYMVKNKLGFIELNDEEKMNILKGFAKDLILILGLNKFTLELLKILGFNLKNISLENDVLNKQNNYILVKKLDSIDNNYDIFDKDDDKIIGRCYTYNDIKQIFINPNEFVNIENVFGAKYDNTFKKITDAPSMDIDKYLVLEHQKF